MKNFLDKLDRLAGNWIETMDNQLQQPIVESMTGAVFTHGTPSEDVVEQPAQQPVTPVPSPVRQASTTEKDTLRNRVLREAR